MATRKKARKKAFNPANNLPPPPPRSPPGSTKSTKRHREGWSTGEVREFKALIKDNTPTRVIALKLQRTEAAIRGKANQLDLSLKPTNQSPRTPRKKK